MLNDSLMPIVIFIDEENRHLYDPIVARWETVTVFPLAASFEQLIDCTADLLLIDCGLQSERGLQLVREIKAHWHGVPIIFLTGASSEELAIKAFKAGAREYFRNPVSMNELMKTIRALLLEESQEKRSSLHAYRTSSAPDPAPFSLRAAELPENLLRAVRFIEMNFATPLQLENIAREGGMSKFHFCRVFKEHLDMSPMSFVTLMKIDRAKLLLGSETSVSSVALKAGFNDLSGFIRHFKRHTGLTPTAYRDTLKR